MLIREQELKLFTAAVAGAGGLVRLAFFSHNAPLKLVDVHRAVDFGFQM